MFLAWMSRSQRAYGKISQTVIFGICLLAFAYTSTTNAQNPAKPAVAKAAPNAAKAIRNQRTHTIKFKDYYSINYLTSLAVSPDGKHAVYGELRWHGKHRNQDLWVTNTKTKERTRLTFDRAYDSSPQWSPDGRWIYFTSRRAKQKGDPALGKRQVWRIRPNGNRLMAVTRAPKGIASYQLSQDGKSLFYKVNKRLVQQGPFKKLRKQFGKIDYGHGVIRAGQIWKLDLVSWHTKKLLDLKRVITEFHVAPNGTQIAMLTTPTNKLITNEGWSRLEIYNTITKKTLLPDAAQWRKGAPSPYGWMESPRWSPDGTQVAFHIGFDGYPGESFVLSIKNHKVTSSIRLTRPQEANIERALQWQPKSNRLCYIATRNAQNYLYCTTVANGKQGSTERLTQDTFTAQGFAFSGDGKQVALNFASVTFPCDVYFGTVSKSTTYTRLTHMNPQIDTWKIPSIKRVQWKSKDGTTVQGVLELPPGYKPGKPLPLLVILHGGPTWSVKRRFRMGYVGRTTFAAQGWATLSPNYRGSTGYGDTFLAQLIGRKNDVDIQDILTGVDAMIKRGIADPKRMALTGWSNGGYLVNCLITQTTRFKAASSGAGVFDTAMQWMIEDTPGHVINYNKGLPWNRSKAMAASSPLYNIHKATTPTIIHVGAHDPRVPPQHSRALYRSLRHYLKVPTQLLVYPRTGHGLRTRKHRAAKMAWDQRWFKHYVLGKGNKAIATKKVGLKKAAKTTKPKPPKKQ